MKENSENTLENFQNFLTSDLPKKYGVSRPVIYERLKALHIKPYKQGNRSYIDAKQLELMDNLHTHLNANGKTDQFVKEQIANGRITTQASPKPEPKTEPQASSQPEGEAIVVRELEAEIIATSQEPHEEVRFAPPQDALAQLEAQKEIKISRSDLQEANERGQYRAAAKVIAEETMTRIFEATEEFTIPGLKEQVERHRQHCKRSRPSQRIADSLNDFLSQTLQSQMKAAGTSGSVTSTSSNKNQSPTLNNGTTPAAS